jgi:23S rRNA-/tRNA-specific pseudouridylate synthase
MNKKGFIDKMIEKHKPYRIYETDDWGILYKPPYWSCNTSIKNSEEHHQKNKNSIIFFLKKCFDIKINNNNAGFLPNFRYGLLHRLDTETSGGLVIAKNNVSLKKFIDIMHVKKNVTKIYICLTNNTSKTDEGLIELPIRCDSVYLNNNDYKSSIKQYCVTSTDKSNKLKRPAQSYYHRIAKLKGKDGKIYSLFFVRIFTGRTHQIRVHMNSMGCPLVSDPTYLDKATLKQNESLCERMFLHNIYLGFKYDNVTNNFVIPLPKDLQNTLDNICCEKNYNIYEIPDKLKYMKYK